MNPRTMLLLTAAAPLLLSPPAGARDITFAGHEWTVRSGTGGPGPNQWSDDDSSVWVDDAGDLHLTLRRVGDRWYASEILSKESFGYGEYRFQLKSNVETLDPQITLGLFTYLNDENEIDIEFARWGRPDHPAGNYSTQPAERPGNHETFDLDLEGDYTTHRFRWEPDRITWQSHHGHYGDDPPAANLIHTWSYAGDDIPVDAAERVHMNLWLFRGEPPQNGQPVEVVISSFEFVPLPEPATGALGLAAVAALALSRYPRVGR